MRTESHQSHFERFKDAFVKELQDFTDSVLDDTRRFAYPSNSSTELMSALPVNLHDALQASKIAYALTLSFRAGVPVFFDDDGEILMPK